MAESKFKEFNHFILKVYRLAMELEVDAFSQRMVSLLANYLHCHTITWLPPLSQTAYCYEGTPLIVLRQRTQVLHPAAATRTQRFNLPNHNKQGDAGTLLIADATIHADVDHTERIELIIDHLYLSYEICHFLHRRTESNSQIRSRAVLDTAGNILEGPALFRRWWNDYPAQSRIAHKHSVSSMPARYPIKKAGYLWVNRVGDYVLVELVLHIDSLLTARESEILTLIKHATTTQAMAHKLNIAVSTIENHLNNIFKKCAVTSRIELLALLAPNNASH